MRQQEIVRLFFAKNAKRENWKYCFNEQCPMAKECARQLSVMFKDCDTTDGRAVFPDALRNGKCKHFAQLRVTKVAWGFRNMLQELKMKDEASVRRLLKELFGSSTSFYRYKLGQSPLKADQQQLILDHLKDLGYADLDFDRYTEEADYAIP